MNEQSIQNMRRVGARIRELRVRRNLSIRELAVMVNMDSGHLCRIESGKKNFTIDTVSRIAEGLGVDVGELFQNPPLHDSGHI